MFRVIVDVKQIKNLAGRRIGKWLVLKDLGTDKDKNRLWLCRCECGLEKPVKAMYLLAGSSRQCVDCGRLPRPYTEELGMPFWNRIVKNAKRRGYAVSLSKSEALEIFLKQDKKCALSGLDICLPRFDTDVRDRKVTASLDRIDNAKGYLKDNVQWLHKDINRMKNNHNQQYFLDLCAKVTEAKKS